MFLPQARRTRDATPHPGSVDCSGPPRIVEETPKLASARALPQRTAYERPHPVRSGESRALGNTGGGAPGRRREGGGVSIERMSAHLSAELAARIVADSRDRVAWIRARSRGITATDVAALTSEKVIPRAADAKLMGSGFSGNAYTAHGRAREPEIAAWVAATHGIQPSSALFHAVVEKRHLATPDGVTVDAAGRVVLAEIKTTNRKWSSIPRTYLRQVWWQQHVLGAERTLVIWEEHDGFVPVGDEPQCQWVDRDEREIGTLVRLATTLIDELYRRTMAGRAPVEKPAPQRELFRALALADG